jgi:hypothetical protein
MSASSTLTTLAKIWSLLLDLQQVEQQGFQAVFMRKSWWHVVTALYHVALDKHCSSCLVQQQPGRRAESLPG